MFPGFRKAGSCSIDHWDTRCDIFVHVPWIQEGSSKHSAQSKNGVLEDRLLNASTHLRRSPGAVVLVAAAARCCCCRRHHHCRCFCFSLIVVFVGVAAAITVAVPPPLMATAAVVPASCQRRHRHFPPPLRSMQEGCPPHVDHPPHGISATAVIAIAA